MKCVWIFIMSWVELILRHEQCTVATVHCSNSCNACCSDLFLLARAHYYIWYAIVQKKFFLFRCLDNVFRTRCNINLSNIFPTWTQVRVKNVPREPETHYPHHQHLPMASTLRLASSSSHSHINECCHCWWQWAHCQIQWQRYLSQFSTYIHNIYMILKVI